MTIKFFITLFCTLMVMHTDLQSTETDLLIEEELRQEEEKALKEEAIFFYHKIQQVKKIPNPILEALGFLAEGTSDKYYQLIRVTKQIETRYYKQKEKQKKFKKQKKAQIHAINIMQNISLAATRTNKKSNKYHSIATKVKQSPINLSESDDLTIKCFICMQPREKIIPMEKVCIGNHTGDFICKACKEEWKKNECPLCRKPLKNKSETKNG